MILLAIMGVAGGAAAQDCHYWTNQYGTRPELPGGVVVGSIKDLTSTLYNPGAISLSKELVLVLTTSSAELSRIAVADAIGPGDDLSDLDAGSSPSIFAVGLPFKGLGDHRLAISYLNRYKFNLDVGVRAVGTRDGISSDPGEEYFTGEVLEANKLRED